MVARAVCGSYTASWSWCTRLLQLWHRQISCEARLLAPPRGFRFPPANCVRTYRNVQATALLHRAKMYQAPPPLSLSCGSKVIHAQKGEEPGNEARDQLRGWKRSRDDALPHSCLYICSLKSYFYYTDR